MVLDIRHLRQEEAVPEMSMGLPQAGPATAPADAPSGPEPDLEVLLERASAAPSLQERARAVEQLRQLVPGEEGLELLWGILDSAGDSRRLVAAQVLGYHRPWLSSRSSVRRVASLARDERDTGVGIALVWCLRQRDEIQEFLHHRRAGMVREAALNLPVNRNTLTALLQALLDGGKPEIERILLHKLRGIHPSLVRDLVDHVVEREGNVPVERLVALTECLPQVPLFEIFVEKRGVPQWDPQQGPDQASASGNWHRLARAVAQVMRDAPSIELLRHLLSRSGEDEVFTRRHSAFLRGALRSTDLDLGPELLKHLERLTFKASEEKVVRLAQLLVQLSDRLQGGAQERARNLLEDWKNRSAALKLRIYHLEQGMP